MLLSQPRRPRASIHQLTKRAYEKIYLRTCQRSVARGLRTKNGNCDTGVAGRFARVNDHHHNNNDNGVSVPGVNSLNN